MYTNKLISSFKERLCEACAAYGLPDGEIAKGLEVSKQTLSAWKCGTRSPKRPTIETIARYFNVQVDWLLGFDVSKSAEEKLVDYYDELDNIGADLLLKLTPRNREVFLRLTPRNIDRLFGYAERLLEEQSDESSAQE